MVIGKWVNRCVSRPDSVLGNFSWLLLWLPEAAAAATGEEVGHVQFADWEKEEEENDLRCCSIKIEQHVLRGDTLRGCRSYTSTYSSSV